MPIVPRDKKNFEIGSKIRVPRMPRWMKPGRGPCGGYGCAICGKRVKPYNCSLKCDGWHWHHKCWHNFLTLKAPHLELELELEPC